MALFLKKSNLLIRCWGCLSLLNWIGPPRKLELEPLAHCWNKAILSLFYRRYFGRCSSELAELVALTHSSGRSSHYSNRLYDFLSPFPEIIRISMSTVFFSTSARFCHYVSPECFPLTYDLKGFKYKVNRYLFFFGLFSISFQLSYILFTLLVFFFL